MVAPGDSLARQAICEIASRDWRGATLPVDLKDLELARDAPEKELDELGRVWKLDERPTDAKA